MNLALYGSFTECHDHTSLILAMAEAYSQELTDAQIEAYVIALYDVPLPHCIQGAVELIRTHDGEWMPKFGVWRLSALHHWREAIRQQEARRPKLDHDENRLTADEFWGLVKTEAENIGEAGEWARTVLANTGKRKCLPGKSFAEELDELNTELDAEIERKLAKLTPEQLEERRRFLERVHGPTDSLVGKISIKICNGCGKTIKADPSYIGPCPAGNIRGNVLLCAGCKPRYPWAQEAS